MTTLKEYHQQGEKHRKMRREENRQQLKAGNALFKLAQELSVEAEMPYRAAFELVCEQNPTLAGSYFEGLKHQAYRAKTYQRG
jgi:hypothetical protein